jgi:hypothetical protein
MIAASVYRVPASARDTRAANRRGGRDGWRADKARSWADAMPARKPRVGAGSMPERKNRELGVPPAEDSER